MATFRYELGVAIDFGAEGPLIFKRVVKAANYKEALTKFVLPDNALNDVVFIMSIGTSIGSVGGAK